MRRDWGTWATAGLVLTALSCGEPPTQDERVVRIGFMEDFSNVSLTEGRYAQLLVTLRSINEQGGLQLADGQHSLDLFAVDHGGTIEGARLALEELDSEGIHAVVGPPWSSLVLGNRDDHGDGAVARAKELGIVMVSGSATARAITTVDDDDLMWRTLASDSVQSRVAADYLIQQKSVRRVSVLYRDDAWGEGMAADFAQAFEELGGSVLASASYDSSGDLSASDYAPQLDAVFSEQPEAILLINFGEVLDIARQIESGGYLKAYGDNLPLFFGTDGIFSRDLVNNLPSSILQNLQGTIPGADETTEDYQAFVDLIEASGVGDATGADENRHDALYLIALAMQAAQSTEGRAVAARLGDVSRADPGDVTVHVDQWAQAREALLAGKSINYDGASGPIEFDAHGDTTVGTVAIWGIDEVDGVMMLREQQQVPFDLR